jgi:LCP family protein required for cell wall assembly
VRRGSCAGGVPPTLPPRKSDAAGQVLAGFPRMARVTWLRPRATQRSALSAARPSGQIPDEIELPTVHDDVSQTNGGDKAARPPRPSPHRPQQRQTPQRRPLIRHRGGNRFARALSWVAVLSSTVILVVSGAAYMYVAYLNGQIHVLSGVFCTGKGCAARPAELAGAENFLIVGSDTRSGSNSTGALTGVAEGTAGAGTVYGNSDTVILVHISSSTHRVTVLSFPRDMLVQLPTTTSSTGVVSGGQAVKFNIAYAVGGPKLLVRQVEAVSGLRVDHYVQVDFSGFISIVNALGGINVCLSVPADDPGDAAEGTGGSGFHSAAGPNIHLDGFRALEFVRQRHGLPNGDIDRINRQHRFMAAIFRNVKSTGTLLNPLKLNQVATSFARDVSVDPGTRLDDLVSLASSLKNLDPSRVAFYTVPTATGPEVYLPYYRALQSVLNPVPAADHALFQAIHDDQDPAHPAAATSRPPAKTAAPSNPAPPLSVALSQISTAVQNASGTPGRGSSAAAALRGLGVSVTSVSTAAVTGQSQTIVHYGTDRAQSAASLHAAIPGSQLLPDASLSPGQLVVAIGSSFTDIHPIALSTPGAENGAGASKREAATASPPSPVVTSPPATTAPDATASAAGVCGP